MKFIAVGDNCIDRYVRQNRKYIGGCSVNFAVYMSRLGFQSAYLGAVGNDENGAYMIEKISSFSVDTEHVHVLPGKTAVTQVELVDGDRRFTGYDEGVLAQFALQNEDFAYLAQFDFLHTSVYGKIDKYLPQISRACAVCYDFANKYDYPCMDEILDHTAYAFFSYDRDDSYIREFLKRAFAHGLTCAVATLGANGSMAYDGNRFYLQGVHPVEVVDTIGAGDSFIAGFMCAVAQGLQTADCLAAGAVRAEDTITHFGAF